ncbi:MAG: hypothetical protein MUO58_18660, partial [Anaerolineales bacterium]|nr:hypothetical protein [Anaerolineales bacterium]
RIMRYIDGNHYEQPNPTPHRRLQTMTLPDTIIRGGNRALDFFLRVDPEMSLMLEFPPRNLAILPGR